VGLSEFHFQRLFQRWAGISPKRFLQFVTLQKAKRLLAADRGVLEASLAVGLSGGSRLHDLFVAVERMTPGQYKARAAGVTVDWAVVDTAIGPALLAGIGGALCGVSFVAGAGDDDDALTELRRRWPQATLRAAPRALRSLASSLDARLRGLPAAPFGVILKGTPFQLQVWEALLRIPSGGLTTYGAVAAAIGAPRAVRAVGSAVGDNPLAVLIPCHRVIRATSGLGGYRWGAERKLALLGAEYARCEPQFSEAEPG
jgi:AraC family transcriptional regulator of adaptative response/methylated-DNA-[protein]-cysteine methyltransferase